jgi:hypothetical protein
MNEAKVRTWAAVCRIGRAFPGLAESTSYGTPALKVAGRLVVRLREDGETLVLRTTFVDRDLLLRAEPATFFIEEHYRNYPAVLTRLARVRPAQLRDLIEAAWRRAAPKRAVRDFDALP